MRSEKQRSLFCKVGRIYFYIRPKERRQAGKFVHTHTQTRRETICENSCLETFYFPVEVGCKVIC